MTSNQGRSIMKSRTHPICNTIDVMERKSVSPTTKEFQAKMKDIREGSELLRRKSKKLLKKAYIAYEINAYSYEKIEDQSHRIFLDTENYTI